MAHLEASIADIVATVWDTVLGMAVELDDTLHLATGDVQTYAGIIQIHGAWEGAIAVQCGESMARHAATVMFSMDASAVSIEDLHDCLGELTNMIGGNLKALLPEPCTLGLPVVVEGHDYRLRLPGAAPVRRSAFRSGEEIIIVTVLERA